MFDKKLMRLVSNERPTMNPELCNGLVMTQLKHCEQYINDILRCAAESFPKGLHYDGLVRCTPYEEYREITRPPKPRHSFDISESDVYMVKLLTSFEGTPLRPRYIMLPFVRQGGIIKLKGTQYKISPVLSGRVFNVEKGGIYMWTPRARFMFGRTGTSFVCNGRIEHTDIVYSPLYNLHGPESSKLHSTLVHYILAEFGLAGMLKRFYDTEVRVGGPELDDLIMTGEWFVFKSRQQPPSGRRKTAYVPSEVRVAIPAANFEPSLNSVMGAIFYIIDSCPEAVRAEDMNEGDLWLRLLPNFIFRSVDSERKAYEEMLSHQDTVRHYMDPITHRILGQAGIECRDFYDLLNYINVNFHDMIIHNDVGSMYGMEMSTVKHLLYHIVHNVFMLMFDLKKLTGDRITAEKITGRMDRLLRRDRIFTVTKHGELSADSIATDCKPYSATCNLVSQTKASSAGRSSKHNNAMLDPGLLLHASQAEVGTYGMMSKAEPSGRAKANPFAYSPERYFISPNPELEDFIKGLTELISR